MSIYTTTQYLRYRLKAKTRHGVHSPFVYGFIEQVLMGLQPSAFVDADSSIQGNVETLPFSYRYLLLLLIRYCQPAAIYIVDVLDVDAILDRLSAIQPNEVVVINGIHNTKENTEAWDALCKHKQVRLSIDIFKVGFLFFKAEFKERQHFVLKY